MGCGSSSAADPDGKGEFDDGPRKKYNKGGKPLDNPGDDFFEVEEATGQEFMAVRPWIGQVTEPTNHNPPNPSKPDCTYELDYVYGYRSQDSRQNVYFNPNGQAVYMTAALGIMLDMNSNTQKFFGGGEVKDARRGRKNNEVGHNDDILGLAISKDRTMAVTGQRGAEPSIFVWDSCTGDMKTRCQLKKGARGINACSFSQCGGYVACVDQSNDHCIHVIEVSSGNVVFNQKGDNNKIYDICFSEEAGSTSFCTTGTRHVYFWDFKSGEKKRGIKAPSQISHCVCCADDKGNYYTGGQNGSVFVWKDREYVTSVEAHKGYVSSIRMSNGTLFSGGKDGEVKSWSCPDLTAKESWSFNSMIRAIDEKDG